MQMMKFDFSLLLTRGRPVPLYKKARDGHAVELISDRPQLFNNEIRGSLLPLAVQLLLIEFEVEIVVQVI